jgi:outer membrane protein assembly factor BamB
VAPALALAVLCLAVYGCSSGRGAVPSQRQAAPASKAAPAAPSGPTGADVDNYFPKTWPVYGSNPQHNAAFGLPAGAPDVLVKGVAWKFREARGLPLDGGPRDENVLGFLAASVKTTQSIGNAVGVTAADGKIFAESDWFKVYALDAVTGKELWQADTINQNMGNPVVADGLVFVGSGDTGFSFANAMKYRAGKRVSRGMGFAAVYALDENTGRKAWVFPTKGEDMPSVVYLNGRIYFGNGDGHIYCLDARTGKKLWATDVGGFDSMSSANYWHDPDTGQDLIFAGFTDPNELYAVDAKDGHVVWKATIPGVFNTGMGDNSPMVDSEKGIVFQDSVVQFDARNRTSGLAIFAVDARTGKVLWTSELGRGASPPAYKAAISMLHNGVVYVGNPANGHLTALDESTGRVIWRTDLGTVVWKGKTMGIQNRGGPTYYKGLIYQAAGPYIFVVDPKDGHILAKYPAGGRFGIVNPVIVGGTMYLGNSWNWVEAIPLPTIYPGAR